MDLTLQVVHMCTDPDGWAGLWAAVNIVLKLGAAASASRMSQIYGAVTGDLPVETADEGTNRMLGGHGMCWGVRWDGTGSSEVSKGGVGWSEEWGRVGWDRVE